MTGRKQVIMWITIFALAIAVGVMMLISLSGCSKTWVELPNGALVSTENFLTDREFKILEYDPNTGLVRVENFGSETSQIVESVLDKVIP